MSGTCISPTRDPATKSIQNSSYVRRVAPCIQSFHNLISWIPPDNWNNRKYNHITKEITLWGNPLLI